MFTGIIQAVGRLVSREARGELQRFVFDAGALDLADVALGDSIAVAGACLTVVALAAPRWEADVSAETLRLTTLGKLAPGAPVNLEKALRLADRLGGHLVSGHVDGMGRVAAIEAGDAAQLWSFAAPSALARYIAVKGSVAVDGVSLTVNSVDATGFGVTLIPHTLAHTSFGSARVGDAVNLEVDLLARYVERLHAARD